MSQAAMSARQPSTQPSVARAAGALLMLTGGLLPVAVGSGSAAHPIPIALLIMVVLAICGLGLLCLVTPSRVPPWVTWAAPWLVTLVTCAPAYGFGSGGDAATPLLVGSALLGGLRFPPLVALLNAALAVAAYAPAAIEADATAGVARAGYLAAGCFAVLVMILPLRREMLMAAGATPGRERADELTGLLDPRGFEELVAHELAVCQRSGRPVALLTLEIGAGADIDDHVLRGATQVLRSQLRDSDVLARAGAAEFGILLPACGTDDAVRRAEHIRSLLVRTAAAFPASFTMSIGVATAPEHAGTAGALAAGAALALRAARTAGGNRIAIAPARQAPAGTGPGDDDPSSGVSPADSVVLP